MSDSVSVPGDAGDAGDGRDAAAPDETAASTLTARDRDVLTRVAEGRSNSEIAEALGVAPQTVKHRITALLRRLNAPDRTGAVVVALQRGWLDIESLQLAGRDD